MQKARYRCEDQPINRGQPVQCSVEFKLIEPFKGLPIIK